MLKGYRQETEPLLLKHNLQIVCERYFMERALYRYLPKAGNADKNFVGAIRNLGAGKPR